MCVVGYCSRESAPLCWRRNQAATDRQGGERGEKPVGEEDLEIRPGASKAVRWAHVALRPPQRLNQVRMHSPLRLWTARSLHICTGLQR